MENFRWQISKKDRATPWGVLSILFVISLAAGAYQLLTENYFGAALFVVAPVIMFMVSTQGQKEFYCEITDEGIKANNKFYPFKKLNFFAIIADSLIVKVKKEKDVVYMPIHFEDAELIREVLSPQLKEKEYEENFSEIVNRFLRIH
ncbi:MAG: DUF5673 domain-containing protein [Candidatus Spechtbacterales bacterium]